MSEEQNSGFKVSDRRMFNPDGSVRENAPELEPSAPEPIIPSSAARTDEIHSTAAQPDRESEPVTNSFEESPAIGEDEEEMTEFMQFLYSFATSTSFIHLGLVEHPATGRAEVNLPAAQQGIGMLILLREKTKGNLTRTENEFFENLLTDLQMQFVSLRGQQSVGR